MRRILILSSLLIAIALGLQATPYAGGCITYRHLGGNEYEIRFDFYRDCSGINAFEVTLDYMCLSDTSLSFASKMSMMPITGNEVTLPCSAVPSSCSVGNGFGVQLHQQIDTVSLPPGNWQIGWGFIRNPVTTITFANYGEHYICSTLDNRNGLANNSAVFVSPPLFIAKYGSELTFTNYATDSDGDSLVYSFYDIFKNDSLTPVDYVQNYSGTNFLSSSKPLTINPVNGQICMKPDQYLSTHMGVKVEEWRTINGTPALIAMTHRETMFKVDYSNSSIPTLSGIDLLQHGYNPNDTIYKIAVLHGQMLEFNVNGHDSDTYDNTVIGNPEKFWISSQSFIPNSSFQVHNNGSDSAYGTFSWTPTIADHRKEPYRFVVFIQDEACPYYEAQSFLFEIYVDSMLQSIETPKISQGLRIYPNPTRDLLFIEQKAVRCTKLYLYSLHGMLLQYIHLDASKEQIDLSDLPSGMYILKSADSKIYKKIIKH